MSHDQESIVAVPGVTIYDVATAWGRQEAPGDYLLAIGKTKGYVTVACGNTPIAARSILSGVSSRRVSSARRQPR